MPELGIKIDINFQSSLTKISGNALIFPAFYSLPVKVPIGQSGYSFNYFSAYPKYLLGVGVPFGIPYLPTPIGFIESLNYVSGINFVNASVFPIDYRYVSDLLGIAEVLNTVSDVSRVESNVFILDFLYRQETGITVPLSWISILIQSELSDLQKLLGINAIQNAEIISFDIGDLPIQDISKPQYIFAGIVFNALPLYSGNSGEGIDLNIWALKILSTKERYLSIEYKNRSINE